MVEDTLELNEETKRAVEQARADISAGKFYTHEQAKKKLGLSNLYERFKRFHSFFVKRRYTDG